MTVSSGDIIRGVWGAWRLAKRDTGGMAMFDISPDGAAKSFVAGALAFPLFLINQIFLFGPSWPVLLQPIPLAIKTLGFAVNWLILPAAFTWILPRLDRGRRLPEAIVACNWASLLIMLAQFAEAVLDKAGLLPWPLSFVALVAVSLACFLYEGFVFRIAIQIDIPIAAGLVLFDFLTSVILNIWIGQMVHPPAFAIVTQVPL
jgi:hypothetical protein